MRRILSLVLFLGGFLLPAGALDQGKMTQVEDWAVNVLSGKWSPGEILSNLREAEAGLPPGTPQARIQLRLMASQGLLDLERKDLAEKVLVEAETLVKGLPDLKSAESRALAVEVRSKMLGVRDVGFIIANAGSIQDEAEAVLKAQPGNIRAQFVTAYGRLYAPALFGGNPERSRQLFQEILRGQPGEKSVQFLALTGLSEAWRKLGRDGERQVALTQARKLFPGNPGLARLSALK